MRHCNTFAEQLLFDHFMQEYSMVETSNKRNYGADGFTMEMVVDIMLKVERSTIEEACQFLIDLSYGDTFYIGTGSFTAEDYMSAACMSGTERYLAESVEDVTFQGGPNGDQWYTLNLQCLLEDHVAACICTYGGDMVARTLGVYS